MKSKVRSKKLLKTVPILELSAKKPGDRLVEFFKLCGWDGEKTVDPTRVKVTNDDYIKLVDSEIEYAIVAYPHLSESDIKLEIRMLWCNTGPSGSGSTPGRVELYLGWIRD